jgi:Peptidase family C25
VQTKRLVRRKRGTLKLSVTVNCHLERKYKPDALKQIDAAIQAWINADAKKRGICTVHVAVDDPAAMLQVWRDYFPEAPRVRPVLGRVTARKIKRAIDDLWEQLAPDYLVLFGGTDIVPMFVVDNPNYSAKGDDDKKVSTDSPYASSFPSYLVPDRVMGRIPDVVSDRDPAWLVDYLATATSWKSKRASFYRETYAICCDQWRYPGKKCMQYIPKPVSELFISPPTRDILTSARNRLSARLHMIQCHGSPKDTSFYGKKDGGRFFQAITSATLRPRLKPATVVATGCCYGAQVFSPKDPHAKKRGQWPMASTYLRKGAFGFVGSTMITLHDPFNMLLADSIVAEYLHSVLSGASIGRAFLDAKQIYLRRLIFQQHYGLDAGDEKTLIEYVLLGDPSIHPIIIGQRRAIALAAEDRELRRVVRKLEALQIRQLLPKRARATPSRAMAKKVFTSAQLALNKHVIKELKEFRIKPTAVRVQKVDTPLHGEGEARKAPRQSLEYHWSGRQVRDGQKQIRVLKAETDLDGNLLPQSTTVIYSS